MNNVMKVIKDFSIELVEQGYESNCTMTLRFKKLNSAIVISKLEDVVVNLELLETS